MLVLPGLWASCSAQGEWGTHRLASGLVPPEGGRATTDAGGWSSSALRALLPDFSKYLFAEST